MPSFRPRVDWIWPLGVLVVILAALYWLPTPSGGESDTRSTLPRGKKAFFQWVASLEKDVGRSVAAIPPKAPPHGQTLLVLGPARNPKPEEWARLKRWVEEGNTLVFAARYAKPAVDLAPFPVEVVAGSRSDVNDLLRRLEDAAADDEADDDEEAREATPKRPEPGVGGAVGDGAKDAKDAKDAKESKDASDTAGAGSAKAGKDGKAAKDGKEAKGQKGTEDDGKGFPWPKRKSSRKKLTKKALRLLYDIRFEEVETPLVKGKAKWASRGTVRLKEAKSPKDGKDRKDGKGEKAEKAAQDGEEPPNDPAAKKEPPALEEPSAIAAKAAQAAEAAERATMDAVPLVRLKKSGALQALRLTVGKGVLVVVASDEVFTNRSLVKGGVTRLLAYRLFEQRHAVGPVRFDEHLNTTGTPQTVGLLFDPLFRPLTLQIFLCALLFGWLGFRRFGPVKPPLAAPRRSIVEHAEALGNLQYRAQASGHAVVAYLEWWRSELHIQGGMRRQADLLQRLALVSGRTPAAIHNLLLEASQAEQTAMPPGRATVIIRELARLRAAMRRDSERPEHP